MEITAAVLSALNAPHDFRRLTLDPPRRDEVLVKIAATGVCASDAHTRSGRIPSPMPCVLGHEGAGVVVDTGEGVTHVVPGDHVALSWMPNCGTCRYCTAGRPVLCSASAPALLAGTLMDGTVRMHDGDQDIHHYSFLSTFADHTVVPAASAVKIPDSVPLDVAALAGCGVLTGYGAVVNRAKVAPGDTVVIYGAGGVGLSAVMGAQLAGADQIIVVDPQEDKRAGAEIFGATRMLAPSDDVVATVRRLTGGAGADVAIDAVGANGLLEQAFDATTPGGTVVCVGVPAADSYAQVPGARFVREEKFLTGSLYGSSRPGQDIPKLLSLFASGRLPIDKLVSQTYRFDELDTAFDDLAAGSNRRGVVIVDPDLVN
ncbi:putative alcohol dehydrogenase D [Streptomyces sp. YIM 130001]|uniref:zinc-binding dehydrogenase n=1 Tax=Streptomyces sp. YIM 130001 TaxID=2259644 RepID=UPI000E6594C4|nr:Zn-dependent alcohol dehydrogenase [Streptomyces sp. YIM 130001]RII15873.1 putative alcohol dehydrogenase D [Streptomyces sp. YIM 130001]